MTELSWLTGYLDEDQLDAAFTEANERMVFGAMQMQRHNTKVDELDFVAEALQLLIHDDLDRTRTDQSTRDLCKRIFNLLRMQVPEGDGIEARRLLLKTCGIGVLADQGPMAMKVLNDRQIPADVGEDSTWSEKVTSSFLDSWLLLIRRNGWQDIDALYQIIEDLRDQQDQYERDYLQHEDVLAHPAAWELVSLYHLARAAEISASYLTQGQAGNRFDVVQQVEAHFDRSRTAAENARAIPLLELIYILSPVAKQMLENSLWAAARGASPSTRRFVEHLVSRESGRSPMLQILPPQRVALNEHGLSRAAQRSVVVSLPTSSGKTLIAQFRILQALSLFEEVRGWVAYVAPTRALVNQVTSRFRRDFEHLGLVVERVSPALEVDSIEASLLQDRDEGSQFRILVTTPEKLDLMLRGGYQEQIGRPLCLVVVDEAHNIAAPERGLRLELLLATINREARDAQFLLLTPFIRNADQLSQWLDPVSNQHISQQVDWQPNDRIVALANQIRGRKRGDFHISLETLATTRETLSIDEPLRVGENRPLGFSWSEAQSPNRLAAATSSSVAYRGPTITLAQRPDYAWTIANDLASYSSPSGNDDHDVATVRRIVAHEFGPDFPLVRMLERGIGVHHSGLPEEMRILTEWLLECGKIQHLVSTTTIAQGVNFPVANVVFATHQYPYGKTMPPEDFWNIAGRAGRVDQGQVGLIAMACPTEARRTELVEFARKNVAALNSTLVAMVKEAMRSHGRLDLHQLSSKPEWSSFVQFIAHTYRQIGDHEEFASEVEQVLRGTLGFQTLRTHNASWASSLILSVQRYAERLSGKPLSLVDSTGFSWESVSATLARIAESRISADTWTADIYAGDRSKLRDMIGIMLDVPELREDLLSAASGSAGDHGDYLARVVSDWVNGMTIPALAATHFSSEDGDQLKSITTCCKRLFRSIAPTVAWGMSALQSLTLGRATSEMAGPEYEQLRNLPAFAFYGVKTDAAIALRLLGVPRAVAQPLATSFQSEPATDEIPRSQGSQLASLRNRLRASNTHDWTSALGERGPDYYRVWQILEGTV